MYRTAAALIVALHFAFIGYVVAGGFLALRWRRTILLHVPAVLWGAAIGVQWVDCPLTWAERWARTRAGMAPLAPGGFIAHYISGVLFPAGWLWAVQLAAVAVAAASWALYFRCHRSRRRADRALTGGGRDA